MSLEDDDENGSGESESENEVDETMEDVDADDDNGDEGDGDGDGDGDGNEEDDEGDNEDDEDQDEPDSPSQPNRLLQNGASTVSRDDKDSLTNPTVTFTSPSPRPPSAGLTYPIPVRPSVKPEALTASFYDIVPTIAAPHSTSINTVTGTPDMRWIFSGGSDGYIRKFNWVDTANGKLMLTVAQRHPFVDSVTKAGVLLSYWENEEPKSLSTPNGDDSATLSPVYSLAVHHQALWLLSGLDSGGINVQSVRHDEGKRITCLQGHTSAVSVLTLSQDERSVLSGSWDKSINDWDLNTGQVKRKFASSGGQISAIELRPQSSLPVPQDSTPLVLSNGTYSSNNAARPTTNGTLANGESISERTASIKEDDNAGEDTHGSPAGSLFGDADSLFGDKDEGPSGSGVHALGDDEDDEFSRAIASGIQPQDDEDGQADVDMIDSGGPVQPAEPTALPAATTEVAPGADEPVANGPDVSQIDAAPNGFPHSEEIRLIEDELSSSVGQTDTPASSDSVFLDASHDGNLRIWDRRQPNPIARISPPRTVPPWCMNACWSPDGNFIYAGRRNGTVDEYSLHKGLREPRRSFKFPSVSGAVSAVRAMPNGKHLICASHDILRIYDLDESAASRHRATPFSVVPGHRTGVISQIYLDPTCRFMISTGGNRGWEGSSTEVLLGYEIGY